MSSNIKFVICVMDALLVLIVLGYIGYMIVSNVTVFMQYLDDNDIQFMWDTQNNLLQRKLGKTNEST